MHTQDLQEVEYRGEEDVTVWLEDLNEGHDPVIFPLWPTAPEHLAVYMEQDGSLGMALSREAMLAARRPDRLWFCRTPKTAFLAETSTLD